MRDGIAARRNPLNMSFGFVDSWNCWGRPAAPSVSS
jgi:hypothetical protein